MSLEVLVFGLFAGLAVLSALIVILHRNPVISTMSLVVTLVSLAALFVLLGAPFIAALQVLIYTGAIVVLFLFVLMLLNVQRESSAVPVAGRGQLWATLLIACAFAGTLAILLWRARGPAPGPLTHEDVALLTIARALFSQYILPFQIIGLLLLAAVIAATVLARKAPAAGAED